MSVIENPYAPPQADLSTPTSAIQPTFFVVAPRKLVLMVLLSQGFYLFYWCYQQWACYRRATGAKVLPLVRAFCSVLFLYSLVMKIRQKLALDGTTYRWWPRATALGLIACGLLPFTYLFFVTAMTAMKLGVCLMIVQISLFVQVQGAVNLIEGDTQGEANNRLTWANAIWIVFGLGMWSLGFIGAFHEQGLS